MAKADTLTTRVSRIESNMVELQDMVKVLLAAQIKTEERFQQTDQRIAELGKQTDQRIAELVSAIGEFIRRNGK